MNTKELKTALVTGAGMGIGLACAEAFARAGYITVLADINEPKEQANKLVSDGYQAVKKMQASYMNGHSLIVDGGVTIK